MVNVNVQEDTKLFLMVLDVFKIVYIVYQDRHFLMVNAHVQEEKQLLLMVLDVFIINNV